MCTPIKPAEPVLKHSPTTKATGNDEDLEMCEQHKIHSRGKQVSLHLFFYSQTAKDQHTHHKAALLV